ncbi:MAG: hypothetical protein HRU70_03510 [Phycisphaeraceae bacterium]|nr:MAG: hypothetical protein HRU70_03510 [Phycisphaeraceae bacterium]
MRNKHGSRATASVWGGTVVVGAMVGVVGFAWAEAYAGDVTVPINPRATYLRTSNDAGALAAPAIDLASIGFGPGDVLRFERLGGYAHQSGSPDNSASGMCGVFSAGSVLLGGSERHRVPGALDASAPFVSGRTFYNSLETDIPEDFLITANAGPGFAVVQVPAGATHVFVCALDSLYHDNTDPNGDFAVNIRLSCRADFDGDGFVDFFDLDAYVGCFEGVACVPGRNADFNGDGFVDFFDLDDFLASFDAGC